MKKLIGMFLILFLAVGVVFTGGCKEEETERVVLASFETYDEVVMHSMSNHFGRMSVQKDGQYVTEGEASLKIEPTGSYTNSVPPTFYIHTDTQAFKMSDFTTVSNLSFDIFNAASEPRHIRVSILGRNDGQEYALPVMEAELAPETWNVVSYDFSDGAIRKGNPGISDITRIQIAFLEYQQTAGSYTPDVYYLDNVAGTLGEIKDFAPQREENEILYFENLGDMRVLGVQGDLALSCETSPLKVSQGNMALKAEGQGTIILYLQNLLAEGAEGESVALDVMNEHSIGARFTFTLVFPGADSDSANVSVSERVFIGAYEWTTYTFDKNSFPEGKTLKDAVSLSVSFPGGTAYLDAIRIV